MCLFMASGFTGVIAQKVGHVDFQSIMIALPERKSAEDTLKKFAASIQNDMRITVIRKELLNMSVTKKGAHLLMFLQ